MSRLLKALIAEAEARERLIMGQEPGKAVGCPGPPLG